MSTLPDHDPLHAQDDGSHEEDPSTDTYEQTDSPESPTEDPPLPYQFAVYEGSNTNGYGESPHADDVVAEPIFIARPAIDDQSHSADTPMLFSAWEQPPIPHVVRIPNFGHLTILAVLVIFGWMCAGLLTLGALHFNLYGVLTIQKAVTEIHYTLGSMIAVYLSAFIAALVVFPMLWGKSFFAGIQWNGEAALRHSLALFGVAFICFLFALVNGLLMPGPDNTPIDRIFRAPGAAWMLFAFGITAAPFFEELFFRGFLLPALCTAFDWASEKIRGVPAPFPDESGHPQWSLPGMAASSLLTSIPFALMHAEQTGYSLGPFILLVCVSLVLCWVRLSKRSLAASVLVHASYNCLLFSIMLLGTGGFQHLDKM